jgi:hypothetical protein
LTAALEWDGNQFVKVLPQLVNGQCGTANIVHKRGVYWRHDDNYQHDWHFIQNLISWYGLPKIVEAGGYKICHIPKRYDV